MEKTTRHIWLVGIVAFAIFAWRWMGVPLGWKSFSPLGITPFQWAWLVTGIALFTLLRSICGRREKWTEGSDSVTWGGRPGSHDMGNSHYPLWFLRCQDLSWLSLICSILIFLFPFFLAGYVWWILDWKDIGKATVLVALMGTMCKLFAYWQPLRKEDAFKRAAPTNRENGNRVRPDSLARFGFLVLAALQGHEEAKWHLKAMLCQGGLDKPAKRDSNG